MTQVQVTTVIALGLFAMLMVCIGVFSYRRTQTLDGFLLGGRNVGAWVTAFAYGTTYFSAVVFVGYAGQHGWNIGVGAMWIGVGNAILGCLLSWLLFANRTRKMTKHLDAKTMPEFFEKRYDSKGMKILGAIVIFIFLVPYSAAVYKGLSSLFEFDISEAMRRNQLYSIATLAADNAEVKKAGNHISAIIEYAEKCFGGTLHEAAKMMSL